MTNAADVLNTHLDGWCRAHGLSFATATPDEVVAEIEIADHHRQFFGVVHGGVYAGMIETACSTGAALDAVARGATVVGLDNHTSFLRATRSGRLRVVARPLRAGRRAPIWEATIYDDENRAVASGRVRLLVGDDLPGAGTA